jgi:hypothetical protein
VPAPVQLIVLGRSHVDGRAGWQLVREQLLCLLAKREVARQ